MNGISVSSGGRSLAAAVLVACLAFAVAPTVATGTVGSSLDVAENQSQISITDTSLDRATIRAGETAVVHATVTNTGASGDSSQLQLTGNDVAYVQTLVRLDPGETRTVAFRYTFDASGEYELAVNGVSAGTLTVTPTESEESEVTTTPRADRETEVPLGAWVFVVVVLAALGSGLVYLSRRR